MTWGSSGGRQRAVLLVGCLIGLGALWWLTPAFYGSGAEGRAGAIATTRTGILTVAAGLIAFFGVTMNLEETRRANEQARVRDQQTHEREREAQLADRYTAAVSQLGSDTLDVRLGGLYALEQIAVDAATHHRTVVEVLSAFVREHTIPGRPGALRRQRDRPPPPAAAAPPGTADLPSAGKTESTSAAPAPVPAPSGPDTDIQAALTVLGRLPPRDGVPRAVLTGAVLTGALLNRANLTDAQLSWANLTNAQLRGANLTRAWLHGANLTRARLFGANLAGARLFGANLTRARLFGADLTDTVELTQEQLESATGDSSTVLPDGVARPASWPARGLDDTPPP